MFGKNCICTAQQKNNNIKLMPSVQKYSKCVNGKHLGSKSRFYLWAVDSNSVMAYCQHLFEHLVITNEQRNFG